jgi:hypothetical protein
MLIKERQVSLPRRFMARISPMRFGSIPRYPGFHGRQRRCHATVMQRMRKGELDSIVGLNRPPKEGTAPNVPHVISMEGMLAPAAAKVSVRGIDLGYTQVATKHALKVPRLETKRPRHRYTLDEGACRPPQARIHGRTLFTCGRIVDTAELPLPHCLRQGGRRAFGGKIFVKPYKPQGRRAFFAPCTAIMKGR